MSVKRKRNLVNGQNRIDPIGSMTYHLLHDEDWVRTAHAHVKKTLVVEPRDVMV